LKISIFSTILCLSLLQCAYPVAHFEVDSTNLSAPAVVRTKNTSRNATSYEWRLNDVLITDASNFTHTFLESGIFKLQLIASKGTKQNDFSEIIEVKAPERCQVYMNTSKGSMIFELSEATPGHLSNFVSLIENGYYIDLAFHRVLDGFVIQIGDQKTRLDPSIIISHEEVIPQEISAGLIHLRGALAAARMPDEINPEKASSGSQFYIVDGHNLTLDDIKNYEATKQLNYTEDQINSYLKQGGSPQLDQEYTVFGYMKSGFDVLELISQVSTDQKDKPLEDVRILEMRIIN